VIGYLLGGWQGETKSVMGLGTGQRNISTALVVAGRNLSIDAVTFLMVIPVVGLVILMPVAGELGKRAALHASQAADWELCESGKSTSS
jgi:BASS family bile acid:Na+ symporter